MHAHVGFLARGRLHVEYADGCKVECKAPQIIAIDPGHDGWVVGMEPAVVIEFDFEGEQLFQAAGHAGRSPPRITAPAVGSDVGLTLV